MFNLRLILSYLPNCLLNCTYGHSARRIRKIVYPGRYKNTFDLVAHRRFGIMARSSLGTATSGTIPSIGTRAFVMVGVVTTMANSTSTQIGIAVAVQTIAETTATSIEGGIDRVREFTKAVG